MKNRGPSLGRNFEIKFDRSLAAFGVSRCAARTERAGAQATPSP